MARASPLFVLPFLLFVALPPLWPCQCESLSTPEYLRASSYAFTGKVTEVSAPKKSKRIVTFDVFERFKGSPGFEFQVQEQVTGTDCDLPFQVGDLYLIYARWQWGDIVTSRCMGSKLLEKAKGDAPALGPSEALKEKLYDRLRNACMGRLDTPCCLSSLKAMRAGYYVPEPEDGCPDGTVPDRLRCVGSYTWCIPYAAPTHRP
jgi:hypothetical protein